MSGMSLSCDDLVSSSNLCIYISCSKCYKLVDNMYIDLRENISPMPYTQCHCLHAQLAPWLHTNTVPQQEELSRLYAY